MKTDLNSTHFTESISGHVVLDFLNTVSMVNGEKVDDLQTDVEAKAWLKNNAGVLGIDAKVINIQGLVETGRRLRETIREAFVARKENKYLNVKPLNEFLQGGKSYTRLEALGNGKYGLKRIQNTKTAEQLFMPVAEAAAELLAKEDFSLIRQCESADCVLWFYDRTKGHKRRWCSMAVCGNRHKVSRFRERQNAT